jgi:uncharacterized membrane protein
MKKIDYFLEIIGLIGIITLFVLPIYYFNDLPNQIPVHYNALGKVDSYGNRATIWVLPVIGLILYIGLTALNLFPFAFNYPTKVTNKNARKLYNLTTRAVRYIKIVLILSFSYLTHKTIEIALNKSSEIGWFFLPVFITSLTVLIGIMIYKIKKV